MELSFASRKVQKICNSQAEMRRKFGEQAATVLQQRLAELCAADTLGDMRHLPRARCHELVGDRKGELAVDLAYPKRLVFKPDHDPVPREPSGGLNWGAVTRVRVLGVVDYH